VQGCDRCRVVTIRRQSFDPAPQVFDLFGPGELCGPRRIMVKGETFRAPSIKPGGQLKSEVVLEHQCKPCRRSIDLDLRDQKVLLPDAGIGQGVGSLHIVFVNDQKNVLAVDYTPHEPRELATAVEIRVDEHIEPQRLQLAGE
jgi:hypothetical protein